MVCRVSFAKTGLRARRRVDSRHHARFWHLTGQWPNQRHRFGGRGELSRRRRGVVMSQKAKFVYIASIVFNVLLVGVLVGQSPRRFDRSAMREQRLEQAIKDLPPASQSRVREKYRELRAAAEPFFSELRQAQDDAVRLLGAEPFDEAAFDRQGAKTNELRSDMSKKLTQVVKNAVKDMTPEERRRFADLLRRPPPPPNQS